MHPQYTPAATLIRWRPFDRGSSHLANKAVLLAPLATPSPARDAFAAAYDALFLEVVAPAVARAMPGETRQGGYLQQALDRR